jgi:homoserine kinase type II
VRPLTTAEVEALPQLCRGSALRFLVTRLVDWLNVPPGALVKPLDRSNTTAGSLPSAHHDAREYGLKR